MDGCIHASMYKYVLQGGREETETILMQGFLIPQNGGHKVPRWSVPNLRHGVIGARSQEDCVDQALEKYNSLNYGAGASPTREVTGLVTGCHKLAEIGNLENIQGYLLCARRCPKLVPNLQNHIKWLLLFLFNRKV